MVMSSKERGLRDMIISKNSKVINLKRQVAELERQLAEYERQLEISNAVIFNIRTGNR